MIPKKKVNTKFDGWGILHWPIDASFIWEKFH